MIPKFGFKVIGDVHGHVHEYLTIVNKSEYPTIQVGDFGFKKEHKWHMKNVDHTRHVVNFGNNDDTTFLDAPHSLGNYDVGTHVMTVRGAFSIDKIYRTENFDWFANEELSHMQMDIAVGVYRNFKPKLMITHDCPRSVCNKLFGTLYDKTTTSNGLQVMFEEHQPEIWIFGHHHKSKTEIINGTKFICLAELETIIV